MKCRLSILCLGLSLLAACDSPSSSDNDKPTPEQIQRALDRSAIEGTLKNLVLGFYIENVGDQSSAASDEIFYLDKWQGLQRIDTIKVNSYATHAYFTFSFKPESQCTYSDIKFTLDGKTVESHELDKGYPPKYLLVKLPESINTEEHDIFVQMDSAKCANLSQSYHFIPGIPSSVVYSGITSFNSRVISINRENEVCRDKFYIDLYENIYDLGSTAIFADTVHSRCYLKNGSDSVMLDLQFDTKGIESLSDHSHAKAYLDDKYLPKFLKGDSTATIGCALFYQRSQSFIEPNVWKYSKDSVKFVNCPFHQIDSLIVSDSLRIATAIYCINRVFGKVKIKDSYRYFDLEPANIRSVEEYSCNDNTKPCIYHHELAYAFEDICGKNCKQDFDSLQIVIQYTGQPYANMKEDLITIPGKPGDLELPQNSAFLDSLINLMTDSKGDILPDYRSFAAKRIANPQK